MNEFSELLRAQVARDAANEKHDLMCTVKSPRALQSTLITDARDAALMRSLCGRNPPRAAC
jgi:hypothetical protein